MSAPQPIPLRSLKERVYQTLAYETGTLLLATPLYQWLFGASASESLQLLAALSAAVVLWAPLHNALFDALDARWFRRVASDRRGFARCVHAFSYEASTMLVTVPLIMVIGGHSFVDALWLDIGLTLFYTAYALVFYWAFDRLRPVRQALPCPTA